MLGSKCNLQCKYCLQHDMATPDDETLVSDKVIQWLKTCVKTQERRLLVTFYGGEPLIYWPAIRQVVRELGAFVNFNIITNGKLLTPEKVDFLNSYNIGVAVSWDGRTVSDTRGYDAIKENQCIIELNRLNLSAVISALAYPKDFLDAAEPVMDAYYMKHGYHPGLNIDTIMDFGNCADLTQMNLDILREQAEDIVKGDSMAYKRFRETFYSINALVSKDKGINAKCGNGVQVWNVDVEGNVYRCHNCGERLGDLDDAPLELIKKALVLDPTPENYEQCRECEVERICRGGCPMVTDKARRKYYCDIKRAFYGPILADIDRPTRTGEELIIN